MAINRNYIAGEWVDGVSVNRDVNPSNTDEIVGEYARADRSLTLKAIAAAKEAALAWSSRNPQDRSDLLDRVGTEILARKEELGLLLAREEGKTLPEAVGETVRAGRLFKFFAGEALRLGGEHIASVRDGMDVDVLREPVGVVGIITPWNFPIAIPAWKIAPALAFGNTVVFKPADLVPGCGWALADILVRAGVPTGVFNLVIGSGSQVGEAIVTSPDVNAITFTGSVEIGRDLSVKAVARGARVQLEMGGKNPLVVLDDAHLETAVSCAVQGAFYSTGQRCTASSRLVVTAGIHDRFVAAVIAKMRTLKVDDAIRPGTDIGPVVSESQLKQDVDYIEIARKEGGKVEGGDIVKRATPGYYLTPALVTETVNSMRINREEVFGPVASVIRVKDYEEALDVANDTSFGLSSGIVTTSLKYATDFKRKSAAGMVMVNAPTAGVDYHVPFGGRKGSSYGPREQGTYAREFYTIVKTCYTAA